MSTEAEIQTEVESLKARFSDTKQLYREVCALLFFRHGITPTTNKLYQYVRRGSMSAPADALTKFWDDLRSKARVEIDHPDLPGDVKDAAATAIASIWQQASAAARQELSALREEVSAHLVTAQDERSAAIRTSAQLRELVEALEAKLTKANLAAESGQAEIESERRAHAATAARHLEIQRTCDDLRSQMDRQRGDFASELAKGRESVDQANERADAAERRALLDIDQERQARAKLEKTAEGLRSQLSNLEAGWREAESQAATTIAQLRASVDALEGARVAMLASNDALISDLAKKRDELAQAQVDLARSQAEANAIGAVLEKFTPPATQPRPVREPKRKG